MDNGTAFYAVKYDSLGRSLRENGSVFAFNFDSSTPLDSIKQNQLIEIKIPIASVPNYTVNIESIKFNERGEVTESQDSVPLFEYYALYETKFTEIGKQKIGFAGELRNENGKVIKRDTLIVPIRVL